MEDNYILTKDPIVNRVIARLASRSDVGVDKYNTTLEDSPQSHKEFIVHLIEELADGLNYSEKLLSMYDGMEIDIRNNLLKQLYKDNAISTKAYYDYIQ